MTPTGFRKLEDFAILEAGDTVVAGSVISCKPPTGTAIPVGQVVTAVISRGVEQKTVPDVVSHTEQEARTES